MSDVSIRVATIDDIARIVDLRLEFLDAVGRPIDDALRHKITEYLTRAIPAGDCVVWVGAATDGDSDEGIVAIGAMSIYERMAWDGVVREGYVLSMYTLPSWRGRGIGAAIVDRMQSFAREGGLRLCLIALDEARPIYERAGFTPDPRYLRWR